MNLFLKSQVPEIFAKETVQLYMTHPVFQFQFEIDVTQNSFSKMTKYVLSPILSPWVTKNEFVFLKTALKECLSCYVYCLNIAASLRSNFPLSSLP